MKNQVDKVNTVNSNYSSNNQFNIKDNSRFSILIVDDIVENIQVLGRIIRREGYKISYAQNGGEALDLIKKSEFDLILLDIMMPIINGIELCKKIREIPASKDVPVIYLTAKVDKDCIIQGFEAGGQDYIAKPFHTPELLVRIKTQLELREKNRQLKELNKNLEKIVEKKTAEIREANRRLKTLSNAKSEFLKIISHELRTPLSSILALSNILELQVKDSQINSYADLLKKNVDRLNQLSETALLITKFKSNLCEINLHPVSLSPIISDTLDILDDQIKQKNIKVSINQQIDLNGLLDPDLIKKCLFSIVENAIQHSYEGGQIDINYTSVENTIILSVKDNGPGFSEFALSHLYEPFTTEDHEYNDKLGVSLSIVKLVMEAHDGEIQVESYADGAKITLKFKDGRTCGLL
ncbi:MAG: response regulator [Hyphomicrobiales bacterium]